MDRTKYILQEIKNYNNQFDKNLFQFKINKMKKTPLNFFRATSHLFYQDINTGIVKIPDKWKNVNNIHSWICGDLHISNVGFFTDNNFNIKFGLNDYDSSCIAPYYLDLIRFCISLYLTDNEYFTDQDLDELIFNFLTKYYEYISINKKISLTRKNIKKLKCNFIYKKLIEISKRPSNFQLSKYTKIKKHKRLFDLENIKLKKPSEFEINSIKDNWNFYINSSKKEFDKSYFKINDITKRINSGLGSLGVNKFYILIHGEKGKNNSNKILEVKQRLSSSVHLSGLTKSFNFYDQADRVYIAMKNMSKSEFTFSGKIKLNKESYTVKELTPYKFSFEIKDFKNVSDFRDFVHTTAIELASAHIRSTDEKQHFYFNPSFNKSVMQSLTSGIININQIIDIIKDYSKTVISDYNVFSDADIIQQ